MIVYPNHWKFKHARSMYTIHSTIYREAITITTHMHLQSYLLRLSTNPLHLQALRVIWVASLASGSTHTRSRASPPLTSTLTILRQVPGSRGRRNRSWSGAGARADNHRSTWHGSLTWSRWFGHSSQCRAYTARAYTATGNNASWTSDGSGEWAGFNINAGEIEVFGWIGLSRNGKLENAQVPIFAVGRGWGFDGWNGES